jgi:hypothetical protein
VVDDDEAGKAGPVEVALGFRRENGFAVDLQNVEDFEYARS